MSPALTQFIPTPTEIGNTAFWMGLVGSVAFVLYLTWKLMDWALDKIAAHATEKAERDADEAFYRQCLRAAGEPNRVWPPVRIR